jgi:hypothetical protein
MISSRRICVSMLVGMLVGSICWLGQPLPLRAEPVDKLLPAETQMVMHLDLRQLQKSQLFKKHLQKPLREALKDNEELKQLQEATGLDVLKDIHTVTIALTKFKIDPANPKDVNPNDFELLAVIRGDFARDPLVKAMKKNEELESRRYQGYDIFITKEDDDGQRAYICVAEDGVILASNQRSRLQKSLDTLQQSQPAKVNKPLRTAIEGIPAGQTLWLAVGEVPLLKELAKQNGDAADALEKLVGFSFTIGVSDKVSVAVRAHGKDEDAAREFRAGFEKLRGFLAFFAANDQQVGPIVQDILNTVKTTAKDTTATLELELTEEIIQKIIKTVQAMLGGAVNQDD